MSGKSKEPLHSFSFKCLFVLCSSHPRCPHVSLHPIQLLIYLVGPRKAWACLLRSNDSFHRRRFAQGSETDFLSTHVFETDIFKLMLLPRDCQSSYPPGSVTHLRASPTPEPLWSQLDLSSIKFLLPEFLISSENGSYSHDCEIVYHRHRHNFKIQYQSQCDSDISECVRSPLMASMNYCTVLKVLCSSGHSKSLICPAALSLCLSCFSMSRSFSYLYPLGSILLYDPSSLIITGQLNSLSP